MRSWRLAKPRTEEAEGWSIESAVESEGPAVRIASQEEEMSIWAELKSSKIELRDNNNKQIVHDKWLKSEILINHHVNGTCDGLLKVVPLAPFIILVIL